MKPLAYIVDDERQDNDDMCGVNPRVLHLYQHNDAPAEAYHGEGQQPPSAPMPQEERQKIERDDEPIEICDGELREEKQIGEQQAEG